MTELNPELEGRLQRHRVQVRQPDADTMVLRHVPANRQFFSKARTNLLVRRMRPGLPFVIAVDADLQYRGQDAVMARAFEVGKLQEGWRVISVAAATSGHFHEAIEVGLLAVGFEEVEPRIIGPGEPSTGRRIIERLGIDLTERAAAPVRTVGRDETLKAAVASLLQRQPRVPVFAGPSGVGKSHLLLAVAAALRERQPDWRVVRVDIGELFAGTVLDSERETVLAAVLECAAPREGRVLALERIDRVVDETVHGAALLASRVEAGARIVGTTLTSATAWVAAAPLARHLHVVAVESLDRAETLAAVGTARDALAAYHGLQIGDAALDAAIDRARALAGAQPATALALLDAACARARAEDAPAVDPAFVYVAAAGFPDIDDIPRPAPLCHRRKEQA
jgi:ATP-dependent Clp protease ATP-binding subunit ClpA